MRLFERLFRERALCGGLPFLCLTLFGVGVGARSMVASIDEARPVMAAATVATADTHQMPSLADCAPCAGCYIAPAPSTHGFRAEGEREAPAWHVHAAPAPSEDWWLDTGREHPRLPVRIAFCRWLD